MSALDWAWSAFAALWGLNIGFYWSTWLHGKWQKKRPESDNEYIGRRVREMGQEVVMQRLFIGTPEDGSITIRRWATLTLPDEEPMRLELSAKVDA